MQDQSTRTTEGASGKIADKNLGDIGPFTVQDIETVARKCVADLGINWNNLSDRARNQYIEVARNTLANVPLGEHLDGLVGGTSGGMKQFQKSLLTEFRNSPKWDEDSFVAGWKITGEGTDIGSGVGGTGTTGG
jgi:hypothetical protein